MNCIYCGQRIHAPPTRLRLALQLAAGLLMVCGFISLVEIFLTGTVR